MLSFAPTNVNVSKLMRHEWNMVKKTSSISEKKTCSKTILNKIWRNTTSKTSKSELMMNLSQNIIFTICIKINCVVFTITTAYYYHYCCHFPPYYSYWFHGYYLTKTVFKFFTYLNISLLLFLSVVSFLLLLLLH